MRAWVLKEADGQIMQYTTFDKVVHMAIYPDKKSAETDNKDYLHGVGKVEETDIQFHIPFPMRT